MRSADTNAVRHRRTRFAPDREVTSDKYPVQIPPIILNALTTSDNSSLDVIRLGMVISGLSIIALAAWAVIVNGQAFNALELGGGLAAIFGGGGFGLAAKARDEAPAPV